MRILLAEDDELLGSGIRAGLAQNGFQVDWVRDGVAAERELATGAYRRPYWTWACRGRTAWRCCARCAHVATPRPCWC